MLRWLTFKCKTGENVLIMALKYTSVTKSTANDLDNVCIKVVWTGEAQWVSSSTMQSLTFITFIVFEKSPTLKVFDRPRHLTNQKHDISGSGFFLMCEDLGRMFENSFPACAFFFFF